MIQSYISRESISIVKFRKIPDRFPIKIVHSAISGSTKMLSNDNFSTGFD